MNAERVLDIFKEICAVPRESGYEKPMTEWLVAWAKSHSLECRTDATGNVLIVRPAAPGRESVPTVVLQGHQDMVCEKKSGSRHDFRKDPIKYEIRDGWMVADDTTLGADDGIGIAAALALLEDDAPSGRVECVFTISEETGMDGAINMEKGFFTGKTLINLDSEDEGELFIGCAGGVNTSVEFRYGTEKIRDGYTAVQLEIGGCAGGHSGDDIDKQRVNAVQQMFRFLYMEAGKGALQLVSVNGGGKFNAIARDCRAVVAVPDAEALKESFRKFGAVLSREFHRSEPGVSVSACDCAAVSAAVSSDVAMRFISSMFACFHGVLEMSQDVPGLVETSSNLASVSMDEPGVISVCTSQRSSSVTRRDMVAAKIEAVFSLAGASVRHFAEYPGWEPDMNSHILACTVASYRRLFGVDPVVRAIHAGLECGLFLERFGELDMISFGPTLRGVHAPGERLELASLDRFVKLLSDVVCNFK